ncbi:MAG: hypothetical protein PHT44_01680 [Candidatus Portnoybacteria bacterium]|nr:hypothetical protein [Candidatus Portnoybacteria bacterium]MDD4982694.1 hypothetical protein [Candidatus Portnoybacteria bacterium]
MKLKTREELAGALVGIGAAVIIVMAIVLSGCGAPRHVAQMEISRNAAVNNQQMRAGSLFLDVNPHTCTWVVDRIYRGYLPREQAIGNVNGLTVFYNDYLYKIELTNAVTYNQENGSLAPNVARVILEPDTTYTVVRYVGSGQWIFHRDYNLQILYFSTDSNAARQYWTNKFGASEFANIVSIAVGSETPSFSSLDLHFQVSGTEIGRKIVGSAVEIVGRGR